MSLVLPKSASVDSTNRRAHQRGPLPGCAAYVSGHRIFIARVGDLSPSGAFLSTNFPDPIGTKATLHIDVDGSSVPLDVQVVRVSFFGGVDGSGAGMGVSFVDVPRDLKRRLVEAWQDG